MWAGKKPSSGHWRFPHGTIPHRISSRISSQGTSHLVSDLTTGSCRRGFFFFFFVLSALSAKVIHFPYLRVCTYLALQRLVPTGPFHSTPPVSPSPRRPLPSFQTGVVARLWKCCIRVQRVGVNSTSPCSDPWLLCCHECHTHRGLLCLLPP